MAALNAAWTTMPWEGILLVLGYGILVRFLLRPRLAKRWKYFLSRQSAPYILLFMGTLLLCAILFGLGTFLVLADHLAMASYFLLVIGVLVEAYDTHPR